MSIAHLIKMNDRGTKSAQMLQKEAQESLCDRSLCMMDMSFEVNRSSAHAIRQI